MPVWKLLHDNDQDRLCYASMEEPVAIIGSVLRKRVRDFTNHSDDLCPREL